MILSHQITPVVRTESPAVVFLHAFPMDGTMWQPVSDQLGQSVRSLIVDFRGFGDTPSEQVGPYAVADLAGDVLETMDSCGIQKAVLAGCSMGGYVAFEAWRRASERIAGLVLCNTRPDADTDAVRERRRALITKTADEGPGWVLPFVESSLVGPETRESHPEVLTRVLEIARKASGLSVIRALEALAARSNSTPLLSAISVPVLVLAGDGDSVTPQTDIKRMADAIPDVRFSVIEGAGHLSPLETPAEVCALISEFLPQLPGCAGA